MDKAITTLKEVLITEKAEVMDKAKATVEAVEIELKTEKEMAILCVTNTKIQCMKGTETELEVMVNAKTETVKVVKAVRTALVETVKVEMVLEEMAREGT